MQSYVDSLMVNNELISDSSFENPNEYTNIKDQKGGNNTINNSATGSFPPIYIMTREEKEKIEQEKQRTSSGKLPVTNKLAVSIKDIMTIRRNEADDNFI